MQPQLKALENEDIQRVVTKPSDYLKTALEDEMNGGRDSALLLTKEDILTLKRYERYGLSLPRTPLQIEQQMGIAATGIPGLDIKDILKTNSAIANHAFSWLSIEREVKQTGINLDMFARNLTDQGGRILEVIEGMDFLEQATLTVAELSDEVINRAVPGLLSERDLTIKSGLVHYLNVLATSIRFHRKSADELKDQIVVFTTTLQENLIPDINLKLSLVKKNNLEDQIRELGKDIERLTNDIEQKNKEYSTTKKNIAWGVFAGPIGVAITGGIFGSKAEKIRKEKNKLVAEKNQKVHELKTKQPVSAAVREMESRFQDMHIRLEDVLESATNLQDLWTMMATYIQSSAKDLESITDNQLLMVFTLQFRAVITPWKEIMGITERLLQIFTSALDQFKLEQN